MTEISVESIRQAVLDALPLDVAQHTDEPCHERRQAHGAAAETLQLVVLQGRELGLQAGRGARVREHLPAVGGHRVATHDYPAAGQTYEVAMGQLAR